MTKRVLIVDDMISMQFGMRGLVRMAGYETVGLARDGREAVSMYKELKPDLVVMDINMPVMDGLEAVREIKRIDSSAKIIMCSTEGDPETVKRSIEEGVVDFVTKPYTRKEVIEALQNALEG
ncbi:MAG: response regulator [bacterium]